MNTPTPDNPVLCAIDTADLDGALRLAERLAGHVGGVKLGKEFFTACGPQGVAAIVAPGHKVFLDLKLHDIPNTVAGAVRAAAGLGCFMLTVHAAGGAAMLQAAAKAAQSAGTEQDRPLVVAITVLTSLGDDVPQSAARRIADELAA